jgi:hypothetical protein
VWTAICLSLAVGTVCAAERWTSPRVEPIIALLEGRVGACGVRTVFGEPDRPIVFDLINRRVEAATEFALIAQGQGSFDGVDHVVLATSSRTTADLLPLAVRSTEPDGGSTLTVRGRVDPTVGAFLMQEVMIGGATFTLQAGGDARQIFTIPGPLPHTVRAPYLHCAGDLFPRTR